MDVDIAIIGAGAAGIGAARRLAGTGLKIVLIEAAPRVGGRAWTLDLAGRKLDMGCSWLHSAGRNAWTSLAEQAGAPIHKRISGWRKQFRDLGFTPDEQDASERSFDQWTERLSKHPPASDIAAEALEPGNEWNDFIRARIGFISGGVLEQMSAADYMTYENASTDDNWRLPGGYGTLVASHLPHAADLRLATAVTEINLGASGVALATTAGPLRARAAILTVSTAMLTGDDIRLPRGLDPWREAAACLPLGRDEKVFLEILEGSPFEPETHVLGDPRDLRTASYGIRPMGSSTIECYLGNDSAAIVAEQGPAAAYAHVIDRLAALFGSDIRRCLRPLITTDWARTTYIGGAYSYALPGQAGARAILARPFEGRLFFAGEATHPFDFSTAHGAHDSGVRAAEEAIAAQTSSMAGV
jgi:monoamine oxidase